MLKERIIDKLLIGGFGFLASVYVAIVLAMIWLLFVALSVACRNSGVWPC